MNSLLKNERKCKAIIHSMQLLVKAERDVECYGNIRSLIKNRAQVHLKLDLRSSSTQIRLEPKFPSNLP